MTGGLEIDRVESERALDLLVTAILKEATLCVGKQTRGLEKDLETTTRTQVRGRLWRGWKSEVFPRGGRAAYDPSGTVFVNGGVRSQGAMAYWTQPGVNKAKSGGYLAIPLPEAGIGRRAVPLSPREWERRHNAKLHFVAGKLGRAALLMARVDRFSGAGNVPRRAGDRRRAVNADGSSAGSKDVPVYVLIPLQRFANKFSVAPIIARREKMLAEDFAARVEKVAGRNFRARG